jgi:hypothetical protein
MPKIVECRNNGFELDRRVLVARKENTRLVHSIRTCDVPSCTNKVHTMKRIYEPYDLIVYCNSCKGE